MITLLLHNIPEGISIAVPIYYSTKGKKRGLICLFISSLGELIEALFSLFLLKNKINNQFIGYMMISISSIMILIVLEEIFPEISLKNKKYCLIGILLGIGLYMINILINI